MSLIIALGSNLGDRTLHLKKAIDELSSHLKLIKTSSYYESAAIEYLNQPDFINQVAEFELPNMDADEVMSLLLDIEKKLGRNRDIPKGPRTLDLDIIFWGLKQYSTDLVSIPHPAWDQRSFVVLPLQELPYFQVLRNHFIIPSTFNNTANKI